MKDNVIGLEEAQLKQIIAEEWMDMDQNDIISRVAALHSYLFELKRDFDYLCECLEIDLKEEE